QRGPCHISPVRARAVVVVVINGGGGDPLVGGHRGGGQGGSRSLGAFPLQVLRLEPMRSLGRGGCVCGGTGRIIRRHLPHKDDCVVESMRCHETRLVLFISVGWLVPRPTRVPRRQWIDASLTPRRERRKAPGRATLACLWG